MIGKFGESANGKANFAPMQRLEAPQWNMRNPFNDLIGMAIKEREMEIKEKEMGLKEKGLGLDEQKFAYNAANDEVSRQFALKLQEMQNKNAIAVKNAEFNANKNMYDENKRKQDMILRSIMDIEQRNKNGSGAVVDLYHPEVQALTKKFSPADVMNAFNTIMGFNGNMNNSNGVVGNGNVYSPYASTNLKDI